MKKGALKPNSTKKPHNLNKSIMLLFGLFAILAVALVLLALVLKVTREEAELESSTTLVRHTTEAAENAYNPTIIEPKEQRQYVYEAHVRFPVSGESDHMRYSYATDNKGSDQFIWVGDYNTLAAGRSLLMSSTIDSYNEVFKKMPTYQQCIRPFLLQFSNEHDAADGYSQIGSRALNAGRTLYVYRQTNCGEFYDGYNVTKEIDSVQALLLQAEGY